MDTKFDFIIVGSGPSGSALAAGLAKSAAKPSVLLLEAGGTNEDLELRVDGQRWLTFMKQGMNFGYKTTPQEHAQNREVDYSRGKGLGGSSAINFGVYTVGARDDYDEWARRVDDDAFSWARMQARYKALETFHGTPPPGMEKYAAPDMANHGTAGPLRVGYTKEWETELPGLLDTYEQAGFPLNPDVNSGNPLGMSALISSSANGVRSTAQDLLTPRPKNLTILTHSPVRRVLLEGTKAVGVETDSKKYFAAKEVILSAGALDTPRILMHSGIGPSDQLKKFGLPVVLDRPAVGQGLRDHEFVPLVMTRSGDKTERAVFHGDQKAMDDALEQWRKDGTGPWAKYATEMGIGFFKLPGLAATPEFQALPREEQEHLRRATVPHYEVFSMFPVHWFIPDFPETAMNYTCLLVFLYNSSARGEACLQSADPDVPLRFDPKFLSTPFDRRVAVDALRDALRVVKHESFQKHTLATMAGPKSESDEDILDYWQEKISSSWHMTGTVKMGKADDPTAVLDSSFRLRGIEGLRVADASATPVLGSCHIQTIAYATGMVCAEKLVAEYALDQAPASVSIGQQLANLGQQIANLAMPKKGPAVESSA